MAEHQTTVDHFWKTGKKLEKHLFQKMLLFHLFSNDFLSLGAQRSAEEKLHSS